MILAGDVGGTNFRLALFEFDGRSLRRIWRQTYPSRGGGWLDPLRRARAAMDLSSIRAASLAVAGPVEDGTAELTNLGWSISAEALARELGLPRAGILNDLEASAYGLLALEERALVTLNAGAGSPVGNRVLCSPGTGLGEAALFWDGQRYWPIASEGGHASFSPLATQEHELALYLRRKHGHVSWERVLSGPGLADIYEFLSTEKGAESEGLEELGAGSDRSAAITRAALTGTCPLAQRALEHFVRLLGVEAGNLALKFLARCGVYLGGGICPRIRAFLERPLFLEGFLDKGRMRSLLERIPVRLVLDPDCALLGAARHAALEAGLFSQA